jgi:hypothetical protein
MVSRRPFVKLEIRVPLLVIGKRCRKEVDVGGGKVMIAV